MDFGEWSAGDSHVWGVSPAIRQAAASALRRLGIEGRLVLRIMSPDAEATYLYVTTGEGLVQMTMGRAPGGTWTLDVELIPWHDVRGLRMTGRIRQELRGASWYEEQWMVSAAHPPVAATTFDSADRTDAEAINFWADCVRRSTAVRSRENQPRVGSGDSADADPSGGLP
jgi:hypothetical protein